MNILKNKQLIDEGLHITRNIWAPYIGYELSKRYGDHWWQKGVLGAIDPKVNRSLLKDGTYAEMTDSLDI